MSDLFEKINGLMVDGKTHAEIKKELVCSQYEINKARRGKKTQPTKPKRHKAILAAPLSIEESKLKAIVFQGSVSDVLSALKGME